MKLRAIICLLALSLLIPLTSVKAIVASQLNGRILLQVESHGEAWYVNPDNSLRYFLGRPADAFQVMRELGLGISNKDFNSFNGLAPSRLSGKILLKVEDSGKAYYVNPVNLQMYYLGNPTDAFNVMRNLGLGITNKNLEMISVSQLSTDWQTYSNKWYSYTIEYPSNWYIDTTYSEKDFTQRGPVEDNEFVGGDTSFSNYKNLSSYNMDNPAPKDLYSVNLMIYKVDTNISYNQFISSKHFGYDTKDNISINGISAVKLTGVSTDQPIGTTVVNTLVKVGNKMFVFNYSGSPISQQEKDIANKIINSFLTK